MPGSSDSEAHSADPETLLRVMGRLDRRDLAQRWLGLVRELPAEERLPEAPLGDAALELMESHLAVFTRLLVENREPSGPELEAIRRAALEWAGQGASIDAMIHGVLLGATVTLQLVAEAASDEERGAVLFATERGMNLLGHYAVALAPLRLHRRAQVVHDEERRSRRLVEALGTGAEISRETSDLAAKLGFEIVDEYRPFVAAATGERPQIQFELASRLRAAGLLAFSDGVRAIGLAPSWSEIDVDAVLRGCVWAVGGTVRRGALADAFADLFPLVDLGCRFGEPGRLNVDEFPLKRLLMRSPQLAAVIERRVLEPLDASPDLIETVATMIANGMRRGPTGTALHLHPSTVDYRMRRAQELTGLDLGDPHDLALTVLALERRALG